MRATAATHTQPPLRLAEVVAAFSLAADLGTGMPMEEAVRSTVIAVRLGEAAGLDEAALRDVYYVTLLAMIGCTGDSHRFAALVSDELAIAGGEGQTVDWGNRMAAMRHLLRHVGERQSLPRRARMVGGLFAAGKCAPTVRPVARASCPRALIRNSGSATSVMEISRLLVSTAPHASRNASLRNNAVAMIGNDSRLSHRTYPTPSMRLTAAMTSAVP